MKKILKVPLVIVATIATAALAATVWNSGSSPGACRGELPSGAFAVYRTKAGDGNCLQGYAWPPQGVQTRGVVVVIHGIHDHARRYGELAQALNAAGIAVIAQDHRGHAGSGGVSQRVDSVKQLADDVSLAMNEAARRYPNVPVFVHGHSMGGLVAAYVAASTDRPLAGAIISSAALKLPPTVSAGQTKVVSAISSLAPALGLEAIDESQVVRDSAARRALAADPLLAREKVPARSIATILGGIETIQPLLKTIKTPLLIMHGQRDVVTNVEGSRQLMAEAKSSDKTLKLYDAALHDLLHEPEAQAVTQEIVSFVSSRIKPAK